jgi:hypothetical protein
MLNLVEPVGFEPTVAFLRRIKSPLRSTVYGNDSILNLVDPAGFEPAMSFRCRIKSPLRSANYGNESMVKLYHEMEK